MKSYEILDSLASHICVIDSGGIIQFVNQSWVDFAKNNGCHIKNISKGVSYLEACKSVYQPRKISEIKSALDGVLKPLQGGVESFELELSCHSSRDNRWFLLRCSKLVSNEDLFVISHTNITKQKLLEAEIREEQNKYQTVVDALMVGVAITNSDGIILYVNSAFSNLYQYAEAELVGMHASQLIHPDYLVEFDRFLRELATTGQFIGNSLDIRKDRSTFHTEITGVAITYKGQPCMLAVVNDVSDKLKAEEARKQVQELYTALFENNQSMIILLDSSTGKIIDANPAACDFYGYPRINMQNMPISKINTLSNAQIKEHMGKAVSKDVNSFKFKHRLANGSIRDVEVFSGPISVGGKNLLCSLVYDISEREALEKEREKLISNLQKAIEEIKILRGIIPICASCKKIRDDHGYWQQIEKYISTHSEAQFSHGICPDCIKELYPEIVRSEIGQD